MKSEATEKPLKSWPRRNADSCMAVVLKRKKARTSFLKKRSKKLL
jgi:hypothetical protein